MVALASIELPDGAIVHLGEDRRWTSDDAESAELVNLITDGLPSGYRPNWPHDTAYLVAKAIPGAKVIHAEVSTEEIPPDATP